MAREYGINGKKSAEVRQVTCSKMADMEEKAAEMAREISRKPTA